MKTKNEKKSKTPTTLFQLLVFLLKSIIKSLPRRIIISLITGIGVLLIHTYLMVVQNEGFNLDSSTRILQYILLLKSGGSGFSDTFRLMNATFFWMLLSAIFWEIVNQIRHAGFKVCLAKTLDNFVRLFSDIFQKPGKVTLSLFFGAVLAGLVTGMLLSNPPVCILLSILLFMNAGARETSLLNIIIYLGWCDLQRLFRVNPRKPFYIDIVLMVIRGISIGLVLYALTHYITHGSVIQYILLFVVAGLMILNIAWKAKPKMASFLFLVTGAILIYTTKAFADDGGWMESGGTLGGWLNSPGAWEAIREGLKPALAVLSIGLGFVPILGDLKDIQEVLTGVDLITGEKLSVQERLITAVAMLVPVVNGKMLRAGTDLAAEGIGLIARHGDEAAGILKNSDEIAGLAASGSKVSNLASKSDEFADLAASGNKASKIASKSDEMADLAGAGKKASNAAGKSDSIADLTGAGNKTSDVLKNSDEISGSAKKMDGITDSAGTGNKASTAGKSGSIPESTASAKTVNDTGTQAGKSGAAAADSNTTGTGGSLSKSQYANLRKKTPSQDIRDMVNPDGPKFDPVYGYSVDKLEADHIVPMKEITEMPGFTQLTEAEQLDILNLPDNFVGLGKATNASKGAKNLTDWKGHSKLGPVPDDVRQTLLQLEKDAKEAITDAIQKGLNKGE